VPPTVSAIVPLFNEEAYVARTVQALSGVLGGLTAAFEIVLVDDGSSDDTRRLVAAAVQADDRVQAVHHDRNRGLGAALRSGFARATGELLLYTDADLPFDLHEVPRAVRLLELQQADLLCGYRFDRTLEGLRRTAYSRGYTLLIRTLFGLPVRDVNFAFKLLRRELLEDLPLASEGSFIDAELLIRAHRRGAHIIQIGVDYFPRHAGRSTLASPRVVRGILREMRRLRRELR